MASGERRYLVAAWFVAVIVGVLACGTVRPQLEATQLERFARMATPTGREPRLVWTPERQGVWAQMRADFEANPLNPPTLGGQYFKLIKENAECACRYGDTGLWATLMFQTTGESRYVDLAWRAIDTTFLRLSGTQLGGNFAREYAAELVLEYDWLYPRLSETQRATFIAKLNELFTVALSNVWSPNAPVRTADSDQTVGVYFGVAFLFLATSDHNRAAAEFFNRPYIGGLDATGRGRTTLRNAIRDYVAMAEGGEWIEGADYNLGTVRLLLLGAEGVRTATGVQHFPEVTRWTSSAALRPIYITTPDRKQSFQWGDTEHPGDFRGRLFNWQTTNGIVAGLSGAETAPYLQRFIFDLAAQHGITGYMSAEPWARMFLTFNPYAASSPLDALAPGWFAEGQGVLTYRTGWDDQASLFGAHVPAQQTLVDHQVSYFGDFQLYRRGVWAISHPLSYGGPPILGPGTNSMLHAGFGAMSEFRNVVAMQQDPAGQFAYISGTTGGQKYEAGYYQPPPTYLHEWTRSLLYLPSADRRADTIVVFDRSNTEDPRQLPALQRYSTPDRTTITGATSLREWILHMPVRPTMSGSAMSWDISSGDRVQVTMLLPRQRKLTAIDETQIWATSGIRPQQLKWQVRIAPEAETPFTTFLNVIDVHEPGAAASAQLLTSAADDVHGTLIRRSGSTDVVAVFNAAPGQALRGPDVAGAATTNADALRQVRVRRTGFTIQWTAATQATQLFVADLDPARSWQYRVDSGPALPLMRPGEAIGRVTVPGAGAHTLAVF